MKILVISDTHIPAVAKSLPAIIKKEAKESDCCIHCGDFIEYQVYEKLNTYTKIYGVCGNMDSVSIREKLPQKQIIKLEDTTIGITHGRGSPNNLINHVTNEFFEELADIDIFIYGHSHKPSDEKISGKIYFNPGSPTDTIFSPYLSYGILEIEGKRIERRIVKIG